MAYRQSYEVVEINDYGQAVCRNLNEWCLANDEYRTFDDYDFDRLVRREDVPLLNLADGI